MPADELAVWEEDYRLNPWHQERQERYAAVALYHLYHNGLGKRPSKPLREFFLFDGREKTVDEYRVALRGMGRVRKARRIDPRVIQEAQRALARSNVAAAHG